MIATAYSAASTSSAHVRQYSGPNIFGAAGYCVRYKDPLPSSQLMVQRFWEALYDIKKTDVLSYIKDNPIIDNALKCLPEIINRYFTQPELVLELYTDNIDQSRLLFLTVKSAHSVAEAYAKMGEVFADPEFDTLFANAEVEARLNVSIG